MNELLGLSIHNIRFRYIENNNYNKVQICHKFSDIKKFSKLIKFIKRIPLEVTYHAPVFYENNPEITYYLHSNEKLRNATFEMLESNIKMAKSLKSNNIIIHFACGYEKNDLNEEETLKIAYESAHRVNELSRLYDIPILFEYTGHNKIFYKVDNWVDIVNRYENIGICLDIGHLYIACETYGLNYYEELNKLAPYTKLMHLWNTRGTRDFLKYGHISVHPDQKFSDGWIDIEKSLKILFKHNVVPIIAEPDFNYGGVSYFEEGMEWVSDILDEITLKRVNRYKEVAVSG